MAREVDNTLSGQDPYSNGDDRFDVPAPVYREAGEWIQGSTIMFQVSKDEFRENVQIAQMTDGPYYIEADPLRIDYPENLDSMTWYYKIAVFCAKGPGKGHWLGRGEWTWYKPAVGQAEITEGTFVQSTTSETEDIPPLFDAAIQKWKANPKLGFTRTFVLPEPSTLETGLEGRLGRECK